MLCSLPPACCFCEGRADGCEVRWADANACSRAGRTHPHKGDHKRVASTTSVVFPASLAPTSAPAEDTSGLGSTTPGGA
jgi:hypothetical protein